MNSNETCEFILDACRSRKMDEAKVEFSHQFEQRVVVESGQMSLIHSVQESVAHISLIKDKKKCSVSLNRFSKTDVKEALDSAEAILKHAVTDSAHRFVSPTEVGKARQLPFLYSPATVNLSLKEMCELAHMSLSVLREKDGLILERLEITKAISEEILCTLAGVNQRNEFSMLEWDIAALTKNQGDDDISGVDYESGFCFDAQRAESSLRGDLESIRHRIEDNRKIASKWNATYRGPVILSPYAVDELLFEVILYHANGMQMLDGKSRFSKMGGKKIASASLTILDDPHSESLMGACQYDDDGIATRARPLIDKGCFCEPILDLFTASKLKQKASGWSGGPFGLEIKNDGSAPWRSWTQQKQPILVVHRFSGNVDPLTGDFSGLIKSSQLWQSGEIQGVVRDTMIAGNVFDLLNGILAISQEQDNVGGEYIAPYLLIDNVTVSAG